MRIAYFQCTAGISGDMILGALVDAGLKLDTLKEELMKLKVPFDLKSRHVLKNGIGGTKVDVIVEEGHVHRHLSHIKNILQESELKGKVKADIIRIFTNLAEAEAKVHNTTVEAVHFHEVGAMDSIIDICGAVIGLELLKIEKIYCSPIHIGTGFTKCAHGIIPLPAPAVVQLLHGIKIYSKGIEKELVTPTGAAVISTLCDNFGEMPSMNIESCGYGAGDRELEIPNLLRICIGNLEDSKNRNFVKEGEAVKVEVNIDDMNPQFYEYISQKLFSAGARDVYLQTAFMKKNRIGSILCVNAGGEDLDRILKIIFEETTTIGVKVFNFHKYMLPYKVKKINTELGEFSVKVAFYGSKISNISPEYEECCERAEEYDMPIKKVYDIVKQTAARQNII
ncbi:nickel pincer cofactor biosynthesis protein LarC [Clostridium sp. HV4-5-A1G]|uniref:nickel pincer cofactor biosynthesis protein LarC n=1 Tax=Clostridium sp. HV4-5-A1G TaxID=2004595 RepID=UPI00123BA921|nr:nickel pincer cofactor biosynthesis protein LarC [Clostridium sp. HV4-5-A1G]KAA8674082.1 nickel pincer cofactor biosynthesis protein LarC [Clostridium sp. HV4-5-A1G]